MRDLAEERGLRVDETRASSATVGALVRVRAAPALPRGRPSRKDYLGQGDRFGADATVVELVGGAAAASRA